MNYHRTSIVGIANEAPRDAYVAEGAMLSISRGRSRAARIHVAASRPVHVVSGGLRFIALFTYLAA